MNFSFHVSLYCSFFCAFAISGSPINLQNFDGSAPFNASIQAKRLVDDIKVEQKEADEGDEKDAVFINPESKNQLEIEKNFAELKKILALKTFVGKAIFANRIENPIKNQAILNERQAILSFLTNNPELLNKLQSFLAKITPQEQEILLKLTLDEQESDEKKLYSNRYVPSFVAKTINTNRFLLALWQVVPHFAGAIITLFDPALHWFGFSGCHGHSHGKKNISKAKSGFKLSSLKNFASYASLIKTTAEAFYNIGNYGLSIRDCYKTLFQKAKALKTASIASETINQLLDNNGPLNTIAKNNIFEKNMHSLVIEINSANNIGSLAQLQYFLSNKQTIHDLKTMLYYLGKVDLYVSLAKCLQDNRLTLCHYTKKSDLTFVLKQAISPQKEGHLTPNSFIYHKAPSIVTGPGGSGKSEYLFMIIANAILAHSLGAIPQAGNSECIISPLDYIISHSNITDTRGVASTSQTEVLRLKKYNEYLTNNPNSKGIIVFDELLKHSNPETASAALVTLVSFFNQYPQLIALYSTHFKALTEIKNTQQLSTKTIQTQEGEAASYEIVAGPNNSCSIIQQLSDALGKGFVFLNNNT